ncbi:uncharacterized protein BDZ83DRAFT_429117 [Colletotrichum acutatum]|uniref:Uncharacterized protein n=1 Tax=Glomerella acutata TaxID=27357 RepID=A0AAD8UDS2_GLOAC|nr:uncharacterized protein BDZ83DRAFT_429117 [Colletotrichum acutatum]KAK1722297.1 hypothetical protein BDZ83DRAFT_429117 [Colletotrichum acutatum]
MAVVVGVKPMQCTSGKGGARELKISEARVPGVVGGRVLSECRRPSENTPRAGGGKHQTITLAAAVLLLPSQISTPVGRRVPSRSTGPGSFLFFSPSSLLLPFGPAKFCFWCQFFLFSMFFLRGQIVTADEISFIKAGRVKLDWTQMMTTGISAARMPGGFRREG